MSKIPSLIDEDPDQAHAIATELLRDNPDDAKALFIIGVIYARADRYGQAIPIFEKAAKLAPNRDEAWNNLGMSLQECGKFADARDAFKRALSIKPKPAHLNNIAVTYLSEGNYSEAKRWVRKALDIDPDNSSAWTTWGFVHLAQGDWKEGWKGYNHCLGGKFRKEVKLGDEPRWNGEYVENLFVYGEQGIGDEIMYASCLGDLEGKVGRVTLECDPRLAGLFRRSFDAIEVHGTRRKDATWAAGRPFDAGSGIGALPKHFRPSPESCPRKPYLTADPERRIQWRALFDSFAKPVIGLCWSGGRAATQRKERAVGLESFRSYIESTDAVFVSLQYQDPTEEIEQTGLPVKVYQRATGTVDLDDLAAMVAELDHIVGIHTTVHHLAGALGKASTVLVPAKAMWNYASGDRLPWYANNVYHRQRKSESWADCIERLLPVHQLAEAAA